jgi:FkbM family methyltransferase
MSIIRSLIKAALKKAGYDIHSRSVKFSEGETMGAGLERLKSKGINPSCIIDVGAAQGTWSLKAIEQWHESRYQLIEPLHEQKDVLEELKKTHSNMDYHLAVAGEGPGEVYLNISDDLDGSGVYGQQTANSRRVPVIPIDHIAGSETSYIIKLDTHGYEVPILKGAAKTLLNTQALIIEVYGFRISPTCLLFHELTAHLETLGFRLVDLVDIMRRPKDNVFWQADAIYIRKDHAVFGDNDYS